MMFRSNVFACAFVLSLIQSAWTHGTVQGIVAGGVWYRGYSPQFQWQNPQPVVAGWSVPKDTDNGFVNDYSSTDMACHREATPGGSYVKATAGNTIQLLWTSWPHVVGPVLTYLSPCNGDCANLDKSTALWTKIDEGGWWGGSDWASNRLIANNNSWTLTIPASIAPGKYVLRHEIIALHQSQDLGGAQNYPQCVNLEITGTGTNSLASSGTVATQLYTANDPGILVNVYWGLKSYVIPGPPVMDGGSSGGGGSGGGSTTSSPPHPTTLATVTGQQPMSTMRTTTKASVLPSASATNKAVLFAGTINGLDARPTKFKCYADEL